MADLKPYFAGDVGLRPTEVGIDALQNSARRLGAYGSQIAQAKGQVYGELARDVKSTIGAAGATAEEYLSHKELSEGSLTYLKTMNGLTTEYNKQMGAAADDPNQAEAISKKFMETQFEPAMQKFNDAFRTEKGTKWAEGRADSLRTHFTEKAMADRVTFAGMAATKNLDTAISIATNTAYQDGHSVDQLLKDLPSIIKEQTSQYSALSGAHGAKFSADTTRKAQVSIIAAGVKGAIERSSDPEQTAKEWTSRYPEFINGAEAGTLARAARTQQKFNEAEGRAARSEQKANELADYNGTVSKLEATAIGQPGGPGADWFKQVAKLADHPGAKYQPNTISTLYGLGQRLIANPPEGPSDPTYVNDLRRRAALPAEDEDSLKGGAIGMALAEGRINKRTAAEISEIQNEVARDPKYRLAVGQLNQFTASLKGAITGATAYSSGDPDKMVLYGQFQAASYQVFRQAYQQGGYAAVQKVLDPTNPDYLGKVAQRFILSSEEAKTRMLDAIKGTSTLPAVKWQDVLERKQAVPGGAGVPGIPLPPRKLGETPTEYLKRLKGE